MLLPSALGFSPHPPVSVYGTGIIQTIAAFLDARLTHFSTYFSIHITASDCETVFPISLLFCLYRFLHSRLVLSSRVPTVLLYDSTGISTCYPSTTTFVLALGPDLPRADQLYSGNLRYSAGRILTFLSLLIPAFSLHSTPLLLPVQLRRDKNAPLPITISKSAASVVCFSPGHFRRRTSRLVSYYALF